jgi:hypothetical protein
MVSGICEAAREGTVAVSGRLFQDRWEDFRFLIAKDYPSIISISESLFAPRPISIARFI